MNNVNYKRARSSFGHKLADSGKAPKRKDGNKLGLRKRFQVIGVSSRDFYAWYSLPALSEISMTKDRDA